ncbi:MAG: NUDIX hydrolase [Methanobacteriota archaeon]
MTFTPHPVNPADPTRFFNADGLQLRLQCFLLVRDAKRRIACVRLKNNALAWNLPGETMRPNEDPNEAARRVAELWFGEKLAPKVAQVVNFPEEGGDKRWYVLFLFEADAPAGGLKAPEDTEEIRFVEPGTIPGPWNLDHGSVWARVR